MNSFFYKRLFRLSRHPSHEELLQYLDGQVSARTEAAIRTHLKGCWSCRLQQEKVERLISDFMEERNSSVPNFPPKALPRFESRLDRLDSEARNPLLFSRLFESLAPGVFLPRLSLRFTLCFIVSLCILFFLIRLGSAPPVSAKEILQYTEKAVAERIRQVPEPVIYQQIEVHSYYSGSPQQDFVTWETWTDGKGHRLRQRVKDASGARFVPSETHQPASLADSPSAPELPAVLAELEQVLLVNRMDIQRPLSPAAYETWRSSIQPRSEEVIETKFPGGDKALTIKTNVAEPFAPNSIVEAEFMVRVEDWHPLMQRFKVRREKGIQNFELTETTFQVLALNTLPNTILTDVLPPTPPNVDPPASIALPPSPTPSHLDLVAAEIEAHYALHRVKACLGEPIEVVRRPSGITVGGLAKTEARKTELLEALQHVPLVVTDIQTIDEALKASSLLLQSESDAGEKSAVARSVETFSVEVQQSRLALEEKLENYFARTPDLAVSTQAGNSREIASARLMDFSREMVSLSRTALFQAWALRRLAEGYGQDQVDDLRPSSQWLLETMLHEHTQELTQQVASLRASLGPVLSSIRSDETQFQSPRPEPQEPTLPATVGQTEAAWTARCLALFYQVKQMSDLVQGLFAGASLTVSPGEGARQLLSGLPQLESGFHLLEGEVAAEFSVQPRLPFSKDKSSQINLGANEGANK